MWRNRKGFTLVEIMIVVAIIGLLAAIAIPNFIKARDTALKNACIGNLKQIQGAIQLYAMDNGKKAGDAVTGGANSDLVPNYIKVWPKCQLTDYNVNQVVDTDPICPKGTGGHNL